LLITASKERAFDAVVRQMRKSYMLLVSIIMSTYREYAPQGAASENGALQKAIDSVLQQTYPHWELIIVGDAAPDAEKIKQYLTTLNDQRIKFINLHTHVGISSPGTIPKIEGIKKTQGDLLAFLDADNEYLPWHLERCVRAFKIDPTLDLVYGNTITQLHNFLISKFLNILSFQWKKPNWTPMRQKILMTSNFLDMSEPVFTRQAYFDVGGLTASHHASDWLLWRAMIQSGHNKFKHLNHLGLIYHTSGLTHHLQYFLLMLAQKINLPYQSMKLRWIQESIKNRFKKKYN
jgi:glycosyltransferase involved in cell wall biosynthesis